MAQSLDALLSANITERHHHTDRATSEPETTPEDEMRLADRLVAEAMHGPLIDGSDWRAIRRAITTWNDNRAGANPQLHLVSAFDTAIARCRRLETGAR